MTPTRVRHRKGVAGQQLQQLQGTGRVASPPPILFQHHGLRSETKSHEDAGELSKRSREVLQGALHAKLNEAGVPSKQQSKRSEQADPERYAAITPDQWPKNSSGSTAGHFQPPNNARGPYPTDRIATKPEGLPIHRQHAA